MLCKPSIYGYIACSLSCSRMRLRGPSRDPESSLAHFLSLAHRTGSSRNRLHDLYEKICTGAGHWSWRRSVGASLSLSLSHTLSLTCSPLLAPSSCCRSCRAFCSSQFAKTPMTVRRLTIGYVVPWEVHTASTSSASTRMNTR